MKWQVHGERTLYSSHYLSFNLVDLELPTGRRFEHEVVRAPTQSAGVLLTDPARGVLLLWRHRFITDQWGWEIPAGRLDPGEAPEVGAAREVLEETGWRPGPLKQILTYSPSPGIQDTVYNVFLATEATRVGPPLDWFEAEKVEWVEAERIRSEIEAGRVRDGMSLTTLAWGLASGAIPG